MHLDWKAIFELVEAGRINGGSRIILSERLLGCGKDPGVAIAQLLEVLGQTVEVENQTLFRRDVLPDLIDDKKNRLLARLRPDEIEHFLDALVFRLDDVEVQVIKCRGSLKNRWIELMSQGPSDRICDQRLVVGFGPFGALELILGTFMKCLELAVLFEHSFEIGDLQILGVARPLESLEVQNR